MSIAHLFEDFRNAGEGSGPFRLYSEEFLEDFRLSSFEQGYKAGWDDAVKTRSSDDAQFSQNISKSLENLSFTFHEVRAQVFSILEPLFIGITENVLPDIAAESLRREIVNLLIENASDLVENRAILFISPGTERYFEQLLGPSMPMAPILTEDPCLTKGQVILRLGPSEKAMDVTSLVLAVQDLIEGFVFDVQEDAKHG